MYKIKYDTNIPIYNLLHCMKVDPKVYCVLSFNSFYRFYSNCTLSFNLAMNVGNIIYFLLWVIGVHTIVIRHTSSTCFLL